MAGQRIRVGDYTPEDAARILAWIEWLERNFPGMQLPRPGSPNEPWPIFFKNVDSVTAPPFALMQVVSPGTVEDEGQNYLTIKRPEDKFGESGW